MKATGIVRNVDELGRIVIPKSMRTRMDLKCGDPIEIFVEGNHIILAKFAPQCIFCASSDEIEVFKDKKVCKKCIAELKG